MTNDKRLFVDIDDTLVKWLPRSSNASPTGHYMGDSWVANEPLIRGIRQFREDNPDTMIVVWSSGGKEYARSWVNRLFSGELLAILSVDKTPEIARVLVRPQDIVVDDVVDFPCSATIYKPDEWP